MNPLAWLRSWRRPAPPPPPTAAEEPAKVIDDWSRPVITSTDYPIAKRAEQIIDDWPDRQLNDELRAESEAKTRRLRAERRDS